MNFLGTRSSTPHLAQGSCGNRRDWRQPFANATHLYNRILVIAKIILTYGLKLTTTDLWANQCSRCFGPAKDKVKASDEEPDVIVCMDGNLQHRCNILASKDDPEEAQYPTVFIWPLKIAKHDTSNQPPPPETHEVIDVTYLINHVIDSIKQYIFSPKADKNQNSGSMW